MRRVVVTGLGMVSPLGGTIDTSWQNLLAGQSGARAIDHFDTTDYACKIACSVPKRAVADIAGDGGGVMSSDDRDNIFNPDDWMSSKEQGRVDDFIIYAIAAAEMAIADSGFEAKTDEEQEKAGVLIGSGIGGLNGIAEGAYTIRDRGVRRLSPFFVPGMLINMASGQVSIRHGLRGPNHSVVTACATGAHALGDAARLIAFGDADVMVAGGAEAAICPLGIAGFIACRALSTHFNDTPERASRPYDKERDGFVMGEGAGVMILEEYEHAKARNAHIYAELIGYGLSGDAYHITSPATDGSGGARAMGSAIKRSKLALEDIGYINAHGTSTPLGDEIELGVVEKLFATVIKNGNGGIAMSSTKSAIGHLLGAAGAVEAIFSVLALRDQIVPPTLNLDNPSVNTRLNLVPHEAQSRTFKAVLSNSFGFGGTNASLIFRSV